MSQLTVRATANAVEGPFDRQRLIPWWDQTGLRDARVMVVGAGAVGNEALKNLALLGIGYLLVVDQDTIATSNLSRTVLFRPEDVGQSKAEVAARRTRELCLEPEAKVDWFHGDMVWELGTGVFRRMDVVLGCVDNLEARLAINRQCRQAGKPWIDAGMHELACRVTVFPVGSEACFECGVSAAQMERSRERYSCDDFRRREVAAGRVPTTQSTSALVAALQVQEAVKLLGGRQKVPGQTLVFQGTVNDFERFHLQPRNDCAAHDAVVEPTPLALSADASLRTFLDRVSAADASGPGCRLDLCGERGFVLRGRCRACLRQWVELMAPSFRVFEDELYCDRCRQGARPSDPEGDELPFDIEVLCSYSLDDSPPVVQQLTLRQIGVPRLGLLPVSATDGTFRYYELVGDASHVVPGLPNND